MRNDMNEQTDDRQEHSDILTKEEIDELLKRLEEPQKQSDQSVLKTGENTN